MRFLLTAFHVRFQQNLRLPRNWLILLLLPVLTLCLMLALPGDDVSAPVQVGVALLDPDADVLWELLEQRSGTVLTFHLCDPDSIDRNVATGKWDCGIVIADDFSHRIKTLDTDKLFTIRIAEGSVIYPLVQETVSACVAELIKRPMAEQYLAQSGIVSDPELPEIRERLDAQLGVEDRVMVSMRTFDGARLQAFDLSTNGVRNILRWGICVSLLIWLLLSAVDLGRWSAQTATKRIFAVRSATSVMCAHMAADSLSVLLAGCIGMLILGDGLAGCCAVGCYVLFLCCLSILLAHLPSIWQSLPILPPFLLVISLLLSGVLLDYSAMFPSLASVVRWMPVSLFMGLCSGGWSCSYPLLLAGFLFLMGAYLLDVLKKHYA